ncbi:acid-soluble spore protein H [Gracilibacillus halophilus YIM-C55.5]|uniref:Small, acid-soluble spore protein H n=1 Tax=Gracilibacillus halophilus YIM-C55.5 TaxID=1308866 RepID=N4WE85_9BACI|nr:small acid-soluble spore protein H [Gracilibacillus halophilus]ENH97544.1 acid-soluble spore protein H [Gracilibacillus halophilus YIM-C55.5]
MDAQRAQEIVDSSDMVAVTYNGENVYIEHVDRSSGNATIHPLDQPEDKQMVEINQLMEQ